MKSKLAAICTLIGGVALTGGAIAFPWCIGDGGGLFLCSDKADRMQFAKDNAQLPYLEFVQRSFVAPTIRYVPLPGNEATAITAHRGGGGINLSAATASGVRERIRQAASEWFNFYCYVRGGKTVRYPINDDADLVNVDRLACHPKGELKNEVLIESPMFGMQGSKSSDYGGIEKDPVITMYHLGTGEEVKKRWGYPKVWTPGDKTNHGTVIAVRVPQAKVQTHDGAETWVKLIELEPSR